MRDFRQTLRLLATLLVPFIITAGGFAQTFSFTADTLIRYVEPNHLAIFHAEFESLIDDTQWVQFHVEPIDFPDENWTISICNDSGCYPPGFNDVNNLYQPFARDTLVSFDVFMTDVGDSGHFTATLTAARDPQNPQTIQFTLINTEVGGVAKWYAAPAGVELVSYPNPFNNETTLEFSLPQREAVELTIYDLLGREVASLLNHQWLNAGAYRFGWSATNSNGVSLPTGVYFAKLTMGTEFKTYRLYLLR